SEFAPRKQITEVLDDGRVAVHRWMMWRHEHSVGRPDGRTPICVGGIHRGQQLRGSSGNVRTIGVGSIRRVHTGAPPKSLRLKGSSRSIPRTTLSPMAMGKRKRHSKQALMWVATDDLIADHVWSIEETVALLG